TIAVQSDTFQRRCSSLSEERGCHPKLSSCWCVRYGIEEGNGNVHAQTRTNGPRMDSIWNETTRCGGVSLQEHSRTRSVPSLLVGGHSHNVPVTYQAFFRYHPG